MFDTLLEEKNPENSRSLTLVNLRTAVNQIDDDQLKRALRLLLPDAGGGGIKVARENVERWFDDAMERVSGWYKRKTQMIILVVAVVVTVALDADSLVIARSLWTDAELRELLVAAAQQANEQAPTADIGAIRDQLAALRLPIGWSLPPCWWQGPANCTLVGTLADILGFLFTVIALSLGAPFWFDLLNRFVEFRGSGERIGTRPKGDGQG